MNLGWKCPACSVVHAPSVLRCECESGGPAMHYGVKYDGTFLRPKMPHVDPISVIVAHGSVTTGASHYNVCRDWNIITCRRCMKSRATADPRSTSWSRLHLIAQAPSTDSGLVIGCPDPMGQHWVFPPDVGETR